MRGPAQAGRRERAQAKRDRFAAQRAGTAGGALSGPSWEDEARERAARAEERARARERRAKAEGTLFGRGKGTKAPKKHSKKGSRHVTG